MNDYTVVKETILRAFQLTSHVYPKHFRNMTKSDNQTYSDFTFHLITAFNKWMKSVNALEDIKVMVNAVITEQIMSMLPADLVVYAADLKIDKITDLAVALDSYVALRGSVSNFSAASAASSSSSSSKVSEVNANFGQNSNNSNTNSYRNNRRTNTSFQNKNKRSQSADSPRDNTNNQQNTKTNGFKCFKCGKPNHIARFCRSKTNRDTNYSTNKNNNVCTNSQMTPNSSNTVNLIHDSISLKTEISRREADVKDVTLISDNFGEVHPLFRPFCQTGFVVDSFGSRHSICVLRDTAALQTLVKRSSLPPTAYKALPEVRLIRGIGDQEVEISMIEFDVELKEFSGRIRAGVVDSLSVAVDLLLANDVYCKFCDIPEVSVVTR